jgi:hypothetical protein
MMMLRLNCLVWNRVGRGCSGFEIGLDVGYGEVGVTFWLMLYLWSCTRGPINALSLLGIFLCALACLCLYMQ